ncbi:hypothetical protein [Streptomyces radicis]|uniref:Uncharacterized protein n=1 Tax=Streptomyces radicis TaxID=1750517 RepID=A0A3A9VTQ6_9ACTN|nr:hypothetical protein [Streptomyces radicis]RKN04149.1 hypothetical protein D7319_29225 [Streptomyces radicis]RKN14522.1 hypothetical protein D7318_29195 [Streptomyces radicis]
MGYDTSFHPVDLRLVEERLLPFVAGHGDDDALDDLIARAVGIRRTRFRAKQWALGALEAKVDALESDVHVWGRPFLVAGDDPEQVADAVQRYLATPADGVDALAREMLARVDPALPGRVTPDEGGGALPGDAELGRSLSWRIRVVRALAIGLRAGRETAPDPDSPSQRHEVDMLGREVAFTLLDFASELTPGWMSRGLTWPTHLLAQADLPRGAFIRPAALHRPLREEFPDLEWLEEETIIHNDMVGGYVPPEAVPATRAHLTAHRDALIAPAANDGWEEYCALNLTKIDEALTLAARLGFGFCEATEIYSGFSGTLN